MSDLPPPLFDLDEPAPQRPLWDRPRWDKIPCHVCGQQLTRWVRLNSAGYGDGWYSWELMEPTWTHLRTHWATMRVLQVWDGPIRNGHVS